MGHFVHTKSGKQYKLIKMYLFNYFTKLMCTSVHHSVAAMKFDYKN